MIALKKASDNRVNKNIFIFGLSGYNLTSKFGLTQKICTSGHWHLHHGKRNFID
ncbi:hypothetical protein N473_25725 [Pseudoalteromonas luteoviolacea CPMOR-1]|uniref:Uncharacterized protein n=1 Tax=Pseudoalteromonas luteoviolacea CPMOR-1 TaxID=1365248 RepID=A0A161XZJ1_9GAMM|nr:hypothetical protein N473_25725 [Pseudoalteromonas luteoviolacea CPMOR-1]